MVNLWLVDAKHSDFSVRPHSETKRFGLLLNEPKSLPASLDSLNRVFVELSRVEIPDTESRATNNFSTRRVGRHL